VFILKDICKWSSLRGDAPTRTFTKAGGIVYNNELNNSVSKCKFTNFNFLTKTSQERKVQGSRTKLYYCNSLWLYLIIDISYGVGKSRGIRRICWLLRHFPSFTRQKHRRRRIDCCWRSQSELLNRLSSCECGKRTTVLVLLTLFFLTLYVLNELRPFELSHRMMWSHKKLFCRLL